MSIYFSDFLTVILLELFSALHQEGPTTGGEKYFFSAPACFLCPYGDNNKWKGKPYYNGECKLYVDDYGEWCENK